MGTKNDQLVIEELQFFFHSLKGISLHVSWEPMHHTLILPFGGKAGSEQIITKTLGLVTFFVLPHHAFLVS